MAGKEKIVKPPKWESIKYHGKLIKWRVLGARKHEQKTGRSYPVVGKPGRIKADFFGKPEGHPELVFIHPLGAWGPRQLKTIVEKKDYANGKYVAYYESKKRR